MSTQAEQLREALVGQLIETGAVRTPTVEAAMRTVPRHAFLPGVPLRQCYANDVVQTKHDPDGVPISAASQPSIVGLMLEQLEVSPGMRILEIGAGTGYNAALLSRLTGPGGHVTTVDVDDDIVAGAKAALTAFSTGPTGTGAANVSVIQGDGALGAPAFAPFDRIIATVGVWDLPLAWQQELAPGGLIVAPLRLRGTVTRSVAFEAVPTRSQAIVSGGHGLGISRGVGPPLPPRLLRSRSSVMCGFMPLRASIASDLRRSISLTASGDVTLEVQQEQDADPDLLSGVLDTERVTVRTGIASTSEWLYLWLTCVLPGGLYGMAVRSPATERGIVAPMFRWGTMAAVAGDSLAYLTLGPTADGEESQEIQVIGHGPGGPALAGAVAGQIRTWSRGYRARTAEFTIRPLALLPPGAWDAGAWDAGARDPGEFAIRTPHNLITVSWPG